MNQRVKWFYFVFIIMLSHTSQTIYGQTDMYPAAYGINALYRNIYNPALLNTSSHYQFLLGNQFFPGAYSQMENHFFIASINLTNDTAKSRNNLGIKIITEKEGEFISKPKAYLSYAWHTPIFKNYRLSAGANLGIVSYIYKPTTISAEGSAYGPDADIALGFYNKTFTLGFSFNQAFNSKLVPKQFYFRYKSFYTLNLEKKFSINEKYSLVLNFQNQNLKNGLPNNNFGIQFLMQKIFLVGTNVLFNERLSFNAGIEHFIISKHDISITAGYNFPLKVSAQSNIQSFELVLIYSHL